MQNTILLLLPPKQAEVQIHWEVLWEPLPLSLVYTAHQAGCSQCCILATEEQAALLEGKLPAYCQRVISTQSPLEEQIIQLMESLRRQQPQASLVTLPWNQPLISPETMTALAHGAKVAIPPEERLEVVNRRTLSQANQLLNQRVVDGHLDNGVDIPFANEVYIGAGVQLAADCRILPGCILKGNTTIGAGSEIGPNTTVEDCTIGAQVTVKSSLLTKSVVGSHCTLGPYLQLRAGCVLGSHVKLGDFVELKNASIGDYTSVAHLTYLGDCDIGAKCNFGCGVVTANYNGKEKFRTTIGDRAFIGCNTNLIAPVHIGEGAYTAAGVTVTKDVPDGALVLGRSPQRNKLGWADEHIAFKK